jgi:hypothetical protein
MTAVDFLMQKLINDYGMQISDDYLIIQEAKEMEKQQMQISDEQIENAAPLGNPTLEEGFIRGAKWYREQLKLK